MTAAGKKPTLVTMPQFVEQSPQSASRANTSIV